MKIDTKSKALILLSVVAVATLLGGFALATYATDSGQENSNNFEVLPPERMMMLGTCGGPHGRMRGQRGNGFVEVSEEYKENVINIAKNDSDVQALLNDGYNITNVRPIIKTVVEADGTVVTKATSAIVMLEKETTGYASVWVDVEQAKVTQIVILTRTVIEKS